MAYGNNRNYNNGGYNNGNNRTVFNAGRGNGYGGQQRQQKKHSGASLSKYTPTSGPNKGSSQMIVNAWMYRRNEGFTKITAVLTSKSKLSDKGWYGSVACDVITGKQKSFYWGMMEKATGRVVIQDLGIILSPKGGKGGYCGPFTK